MTLPSLLTSALYASAPATGFHSSWTLCASTAVAVTAGGSGAPGTRGCGDGGSGSPVTRNGSRAGAPRRVGLRVRTRSRACAVPPSGTSTTSGDTRRPSRSSASDGTRRRRTGALPQLVNASRCRADQRPAELTGVRVACSPKTRPTSRSPSTTAAAEGSTRDATRTPYGTSPAVAAPAGAANATTTLVSCCG